MRRSRRTPSVKVAPEVLTNRVQAPLGNKGKLASITPKKPSIIPARVRWWLSMRQRAMVMAAGSREFKSLTFCCSRAIPKGEKQDGTDNKYKSPGKISIGPYVNQWGEPVVDDDLPIDSEGVKKRYVYKWMQHCASPMLCFICAPRIRYERRQEIEKITECMIESNYTPLFITYTVPHDLFSDPEKQVKSFQDAQKYLKSGRFWKEFKEEYKYEHCITALELTDDNPDSKNKTGCHFHSHCIYFFNKQISQDELSEIEKKLKERWLAAIQKKGVEVKNEEHVIRRGCVIEKVKPKCKTTPTKIAAYAAKAAACEISPGILSKKGRAVDRWTHWDVLAAACTTKPELQPRALSIMRALKGKHWLHFSKGLKRICGIDEKSDKEIMTGHEENIQTEDILTFEAEEWCELDKYKMQRELLDIYNKQSLVDRVPLEVIIRDKIHPETGEDLESARTVSAFLTLEQARKTSGVDGFQVFSGSVQLSLFGGGL